MARFIHYALAATQEAMAQSGLQSPRRLPNGWASSSARHRGFEIIEREHTNLMQGGPRKSHLLHSLRHRQHGSRPGEHPLCATGPISATATACASSANAIGDSARMILHGDVDVMIAGGAEAAVTQLSVGGFASMRALSTRNDEPTRASRPFDKDRDAS